MGDTNGIWGIVIKNIIIKGNFDTGINIKTTDGWFTNLTFTDICMVNCAKFINIYTEKNATLVKLLFENISAQMTKSTECFAQISGANNVKFLNCIPWDYYDVGVTPYIINPKTTGEVIISKDDIYENRFPVKFVESPCTPQLKLTFSLKVLGSTSYDSIAFDVRYFPYLNEVNNEETPYMVYDFMWLPEGIYYLNYDLEVLIRFLKKCTISVPVLIRTYSSYFEVNRLGVYRSVITLYLNVEQKNSNRTFIYRAVLDRTHANSKLYFNLLNKALVKTTESQIPYDTSNILLFQNDNNWYNNERLFYKNSDERIVDYDGYEHNIPRLISSSNLSSYTDNPERNCGMSLFSMQYKMPVYINQEGKLVDYEGNIDLNRTLYRQDAIEILNDNKTINKLYSIYFLDDYNQGFVYIYNNMIYSFNNEAIFYIIEDLDKLQSKILKQKKILFLEPINSVNITFTDNTIVHIKNLVINSSFKGNNLTIFVDTNQKIENVKVPEDAHIIYLKNTYNGTTSDREKVHLTKGFQYFDTTLDKPIWWTGSKWVDATGANI